MEHATEHVQFLRRMTWGEVLADWREQEESWGWEDVWKSRGFASWDAWRETYVSPLRLAEREWRIVRVVHPELVIPRMWAVAFTGWKRYLLPGSQRVRLSDIARHPSIVSNDKIAAIEASFPTSTTLIAVQCGDDMALFEGMHRAVVIARAAARGVVISKEVLLALTVFDETERPLFEQAITFTA